MDQRFPKSARLLKRADFRLVYDTGTPYRNTGFHLFVRPRAEKTDQPTRLGITVTRAAGNAVVRNRLRRRVREKFRRIRHRVLPGYDLVVNIHRGMSKTDAARFDRLLEDVLEKARVLQNAADTD